jgi:phosphotransferase system HPr (HPr) family protein
MQSSVLIVTDDVGLHARPAAEFVKLAGQFKSSLQVRNLTKQSDWVDAKSILMVLTLGVEQNHEIELMAEGEDEEVAIQSMEELVQHNFKG